MKDGWVYKKLGDVCEIYQPQTLSTSEMISDGDYYVYGANGIIGRYSKYNHESPELLMTCRGASCGNLNISLPKSWINGNAMVLHPKENAGIISIHFLYYLLSSLDISPIISCGAQPQITRISLAPFRIPLPPLAVQQEIASVLDSFTSLIEKMKEEEKLRKKQIEYYREKLLAFDNVEGNSVKWVKLSDVCLYSKDRIDVSDLPKKSYTGVENLLKNKQGRTESTVVPLGSVIKYEKNDILIGNIRPNLRKIWKADSIGGTNGDVLCIRIKKGATKELSSDYLFHILASENFFEFDIKYSKGAKMPRGDKTAIMKYLIPVPPLAQQHHIASTLDLFETYIMKLERLIELRQKQYEYYRDKLLAFE